MLQGLFRVLFLEIGRGLTNLAYGAHGTKARKMKNGSRYSIGAIVWSFLLILLVLGCFCGCDQDNKSEDKPIEIKPSLIEQTESDYIISTDWMTFYLSKGDLEIISNICHYGNSFFRNILDI